MIIRAPLLALAAVSACATAPDAEPDRSELTIPPALVHEHEELHAELVALTSKPGQTGAAARRVADALHDHFVREEEIALPPLGALAALADGRSPPDPDRVQELAERLQAELPAMLTQHQRIVGALEELETAAQAEKHDDALAFARALKLHARNEEQVLYPAAIVAGELVRASRPPTHNCPPHPPH